MDLGIRGLRGLVTAGAGGIGLEIARSFVREGAKVPLSVSFMNTWTMRPPFAGSPGRP
ncbi:hypothetical protein ACFQY9_26560 [Microvirga aerilata]|jgi:short-subunit dehydrogenase involved in D-alanine esterification of teichoic acids|uniref:hypothetical protein n=1 Tax=Microvirga aerilata TaxID=670292 RepID=UPI003644DDF1